VLIIDSVVLPMVLILIYSRGSNPFLYTKNISLEPEAINTGL